MCGRDRLRCTLVGLAAVFVLVPRSVAACSCSGPSGVDILHGNASVFTGSVSRVEYLEPDRRDHEPQILVTFDVDEVWRGPVSRTFVVRTVHNKWTCRGFYFQEGEKYLVVARDVLKREAARRQPAEFGGVSLCNGTSLLKDARA